VQEILNNNKNIKDYLLGKAGEHMVCADLISKGYTAYLIEQILRYDIVMDLNGKLLRIQVKTTFEQKKIIQRKSTIPVYQFQARRCGKGGRQSYSNEDIDIMAFVCLKDKLIAYVPIQSVGQTMHFYLKGYNNPKNGKNIKFIENYTIEKALNDFLNPVIQNKLF
jgi:hypothetical protein